MSSEQRSASAVRNLRSLFENKAGDNTSPDSRGRSPSGLNANSSDKENGNRPNSKIRASWVPVGVDRNMAANVDDNANAAAGQRRGSFSDVGGDGGLSELKKTVSQQQGSTEVPEDAVSSAAASAAATPTRKAGEWQAPPEKSPLARKEDQEPANPDKPVTGAEEEPVNMTPADPVDEQAVSGGEALPPVAEDLRTTAAVPTSGPEKKAATPKAASNTKPAATTTKPAPKPSAVKSPSSQPKSPAKTETAAPKTTTRRQSRSSLTAPTAASMARLGTDKAAGSKTSPPSKPKPREVTKPVNLPSHLTAPTASSRAKHEPTAEPSQSSFKTSVTSRPKQPTTAKTSTRSSQVPHERPGSRSSQTSGRRSGTHADGSFLERMMKPTASSASKNHEKSDVKSPPRGKTAAPKSKTNGSAPKPTPKTAAPPKAQPEPVFKAQPNAVEEPPVVIAQTNAEEVIPSMAAGGTPQEPPLPAAAAGNETPNPHGGAAAEAGTLEATPAALGGEETIR